MSNKDPVIDGDLVWDEGLEEELFMAFVGLYMRNEDGDFVSLDDKYNVLKDSLRQHINDWIKRDYILKTTALSLLADLSSRCAGGADPEKALTSIVTKLGLKEESS